MVIVNVWPIAGGLAGYFTNGSRDTPRNPNPAISQTRLRGRMLNRPYSTKYATATSAPMAAENAMMPVAIPIVD